MKSKILAAAAAAALVFGLSGCGGGSSGTDSANMGPANDPNSDFITYYVRGSGITTADVTYRTSTGTSQRTVTLPWSEFRSAGKGDFLYVSAQKNSASGTVMVEITGSIGTLAYSSSSAAYGIATASASCCKK